MVGITEFTGSSSKLTPHPSANVISVWDSGNPMIAGFHLKNNKKKNKKKKKKKKQILDIFHGMGCKCFIIQNIKK